MDDTLREIKKSIVNMAHYSHASHVGSALSVSDVLYVIYSKVADITPENLRDTCRDKVILSKGHASTALYATLAHVGLMDKSLLDSYYITGGKLPGHLDMTSVPGVDASTGSLGHGLSLGLGMALADSKHHVFVIMGDGECDEGSVWEAAMLLGRLRLQNLTAVVDKNELQGFGRTADIMADQNLAERFSSFGLDVQEVNGHDLQQLENALKKPSDRTKLIISHSIKGQGVSYMEDQFIWHYKSPDDEQLEIAFRELSK